MKIENFGKDIYGIMFNFNQVKSSDIETLERISRDFDNIKI